MKIRGQYRDINIVLKALQYTIFDISHSLMRLASNHPDLPCIRLTPLSFHMQHIVGKLELSFVESLLDSVQLKLLLCAYQLICAFNFSPTYTGPLYPCF